MPAGWWNGNAKNLEKECENYEKKIERMGGTVSDNSADVYVFRSFGASLWEWLQGGAAEVGYTVE
jgi:hypothetical protein